MHVTQTGEVMLTYLASTLYHAYKTMYSTKQVQ
jgi:hypothetical protein